MAHLSIPNSKIIMKKTILWDNDGVLVDTEKYFMEANRKLLNEFDIEVTEELYKRISLIEGKSLLSLLDSRGYTGEEILKLRDRRDDIYISLVMENDITIEGVKDVLSSLHGKIKMGIVTTTKREYVAKIHEITGCLKYFDFIVAREDYKRAKPFPDPYLLGISQSKSLAEECIAVEDTERGLKAARSAGVDCIIIPSELTIGTEFKEAGLILDNIRDVTIDLINEL